MKHTDPIRSPKAFLLKFAVYYFVMCLSFIGLLPLNAIGAIDKPLTDPAKLEQPQKEKVVQLNDVKVLIADYELIRKDFPQTKDLPESEINRWLVGKVGYIAAPQVLQTEVNSEIHTTSATTTAYRPFGYNRALVFRVGPKQFIDVKGSGTLNPQQGHHSNGLAAINEVLREFVIEKKLQQILGDSGLTNKTVGSYAVLDYGFDVKFPDGNILPAGAVLRQAHERNNEDKVRSMGNQFFGKSLSRKLELAIRGYGLTSSREGTYESLKPGQELRDLINIQGNSRGELFDFGTYRATSSFSLDTYWYPDAKVDNAVPILRTTDKDFVQPNPARMLPLEEWGRVFPANAIPYEVIRKQIHDLVTAYKAGTKTTSDIRQYFDLKMSQGNFPAAQKYRNSNTLMCRRMFL